MRIKTKVNRALATKTILDQVVDDAPSRQEGMKDLIELLIWMSVRSPRMLDRALADMRARKEHARA